MAYLKNKCKDICTSLHRIQVKWIGKNRRKTNNSKYKTSLRHDKHQDSLRTQNDHDHDHRMMMIMPNLPLPFVITKLCSFPWYLVRPHALGKTIHWASWFHPMPFLDLQKLNMPAGWLDADSCNVLNNIYWSTLDSLLIRTGEAQVDKSFQQKFTL